VVCRNRDKHYQSTVNPTGTTRAAVIQKPVNVVMVPIENGNAPAIESVGDILERELESMIQDWLFRVKKESDLTNIPLNLEERRGHLPTLARGGRCGCV
jgi:hypothetical protein